MTDKLICQVLPVKSNEIEQARNVVSDMTKPIVANEHSLWSMLDGWKEALLNFGIRVLLAIIIFFIGRWLIGRISKFLSHVMERRHLEGVAVSLINSIVVAVLYISLGIGMASALGVQSVSFAAVLASMGLAVGMALSGQLQNLAGGVIIVVTKPFTIGNYIQAQNVEGIVQSVSLFHTVITTPENKKIYIPNGALSSGVIVNINSVSERRLDWTIGIDYDSDVDKAIALLHELLKKDERILSDPAPYVGVSALSASSVNLLVLAWVKTANYAPTNHDFNKAVFLAFNEAGINFPFPQVTLSHR